MKLKTLIEPIISVTAGKRHVIAISDVSTMYAWGTNDFGQLAEDPNVTPVIIIPKRVKFFEGKNVVQAYAGDYSSAAVTKSNILYVWGQV